MYPGSAISYTLSSEEGEGCAVEGESRGNEAKMVMEMRYKIQEPQNSFWSGECHSHLKCLYIPQKPNFLVGGCAYLCVWRRRFIAVVQFIWQRLLHLVEFWCQESWSWFLTRMCCLWRSRTRGIPEDQKTSLVLY